MNIIATKVIHIAPKTDATSLKLYITTTLINNTIAKMMIEIIVFHSTYLHTGRIIISF